MSKTTCHQCSRDFVHIGKHWAKAPCEYQTIDIEQHEIIIGLMLGDGCLDRSHSNPRLLVVMTNKEYLSYIDEKLDPFTTGVSFRNSAVEQAQMSRESGFHEEATADDYNDVYQVRTISHPELVQYAEWYDTGSKRFPADLSLTPPVVKHWYVCDGTIKHRGNGTRLPSIEISSANESDRMDWLVGKFEEMGLSPTGSSQSLSFGVDDSAKLWEMMGSPPPGFKGKWPERDISFRPWRDENILGELHEKGLSRAEKADKLGCSKPTVAKWMREFGFVDEGDDE